jgi:hypothetical protein
VGLATTGIELTAELTVSTTCVACSKIESIILYLFN